ncbi:efflux transporter, outer membrane factor (OMF) lipoprotein, NodT family [Trichlorobacter thiogenes]|uniref:Efflux transporter, outer membrane factor (OMF) lipoprotein, NodT family n=1 Tax=Trichlorobacter thiogenes TaxID=115783 RepID=A0A1T4RKC5_9BACT|nr:efflux transporter outer membrane subunit [Trichlorobacter thiogenes]SKA16131.1 efflux transporter, outer membrane factor (OMF) lipoprotein, NodT family [Trichlorobacter thiogenes]
MPRLFFHLIRLALAFCMMLLLSSCSLLPRSEFAQPQMTLPAGWQQHQTVDGASIVAGDGWWKSFNDPLLDQLIERALRSNNNLVVAAIKVRRAQLQAGLANTNLTPSLNAGATSSLSQDLTSKTTTQSHAVTGQLSYELDLWGRLASIRDAARWEAEATEQDRRSTALSLIGTVATAYWQIAWLNQRISLAEASIAAAEKTVQLVQIKYQSGAVSGIDLVQAEQTVASQQATLVQLQQQRIEARNTLALLFDQAPQQHLAEQQRLPDAALPAIKAGLPVELLARRPDLRAAELRLREYLANVDASRASFYPTFTLTGNLGSSSISLEQVLKNPIATLGAGLTLPFLQWNTAKLTVAVSQTSYEEAVVNFRQTLYTALGDVENSLAAVRSYQEQGKHLERALQLAQQAEQRAAVRYQAGATGVQAWLDEQERSRTAEIQLLENRLNRLKARMTLHQALGGGMTERSNPAKHG